MEQKRGRKPLRFEVWGFGSKDGVVIPLKKRLISLVINKCTVLLVLLFLDREVIKGHRISGCVHS